MHQKTAAIKYTNMYLFVLFEEENIKDDSSAMQSIIQILLNPWKQSNYIFQ